MSVQTPQRLLDLIKPQAQAPLTHPRLGCAWYRFELIEGQLESYRSYMASLIRESYVDPAYLAEIFSREGFTGVASLLRERIPPEGAAFGVRIGDFGEVVAHGVLVDVFGYRIPVIKLRYKTNWTKAAFGIDIIAFRFDPEDPSKDAVAFSEVKSSRERDYGVCDVFAEIRQLSQAERAEARQKMRNAVRFVSERLYEQGQFDLEKRVYRFLDCITKPHFVEAFYPFLVRDTTTWDDDALDQVQPSSDDSERTVLCLFLLRDLVDVANAAFQMATGGVIEDGTP